MTQNRREFIERLTTGAMLATVPFSPDALRALSASGTRSAAEEWDLSWTSKLTGKYKAVFDVPEIESGSIFERFYRGPEQEPEPGGLGLGLWIVKSIIDRHRGTISARRIDERTRFEVVLPVVQETNDS